jgi:uncharacterized membrane protein YhhN
MAKIALLIYSLIGALNVWSAVIEQPLLHTLTKPLLMPMLLLYVFSQTHIVIRNKLIFILVFAWFGDMFLLVPGNSPLYFQLGLASFLIMQIGYIRLFSLQSSTGKFNVGQWFSLSIIPVLIYVFGFLAFLLPLIPAALYIPVSLYALALGAMLYAAYLRKLDSSYYFIFIGAILFVISDSLLALAKFYFSFTGNSIYVMFTYILAQLLLILGLCKLQPKN